MGEKRGRNIDVRGRRRSVASRSRPDQGSNPQPRYVPDGELNPQLNPQPFGAQDDTPTN